MTRQDILAKVKRGELDTNDALVLMEKLDRMNGVVPAKNGKVRKQPRFQVAEKSGWCSVYFDGMWRPCTLPAQIWLELLEPENIERLKSFIEENKSKFRNRGSH